MPELLKNCHFIRLKEICVILLAAFSMLVTACGEEGTQKAQVQEPISVEKVEPASITWKDEYVLTGVGTKGSFISIASDTADVSDVYKEGESWKCRVKNLKHGDNIIDVETKNIDKKTIWRYVINRFELPSLNPAGRFAVIGHRGAPTLAPENSLSSINMAWKVGADWVEVDVYLTSDNRLAIIHDHTTLRTTGIDLNVSSASLDSLRQLTLKPVGGYSSEKIPTLEEVLDILPPERSLMLDIKTGKEILPYLMDVIAASGKAAQVVICSYGWIVPAEFRKKVPGVRVAFALPMNYNDFQRDRSMINEYQIEALSQAADKINSSLAYAQLLKKSNVSLFAYTVNDVMQADILASNGVTHIITDLPELLKKSSL